MPSSVIEIMFFSAAERIADVIFRGKQLRYRYFEVSREDWGAFLAAPSKGTYLNQVFKAKHRDRKLSPGEGLSRNTPGVEFWPGNASDR